MTREKAAKIVLELGEVLTRHNVILDYDSNSNVTLAEWVGEGSPPNAFRLIQYHGNNGEWIELDL
jgi:hypothetical protein